MPRKSHIAIAVLIVVGLCSLAWAESASVALEKGVYTEETVGDMEAAISIYEQIIKDVEAGRTPLARAGLAEAHYRLGSCYLRKGQSQQAAAVLEKLIEQYPDQRTFVARARPLLDRIVVPDPAAIMPADTLFYVELGSPGKVVETILNMLKDTPFANPLAAMGGGGGIGPAVRSPEQIIAAMLNPSMIEEFKKVRGLAFGFSELGFQGASKQVVVLYPGESDALRGLVMAGLRMAMQPADPIEGMETLQGVTRTGPASVAFDDNAIIAAEDRELLTWCVRQYKGVADEPTLASANEAFARLGRQVRQDSALTWWWHSSRMFPIIEDILAGLRQAEEFRQVDSFVDFKNIGEVVARIVLDEKNPFIEATANLKEGHRCLAYNLVRTPNLSRRGFEAVPAEALAAFSFALGEAADEGVEAGREALKQLTGLDVGRELFDNIEQVTVFLLPADSAASEGALGKNLSPVVPRLGLAITSRDPQQTRQLLERLLGTWDTVFRLMDRTQNHSEEDAVAGRYLIGEFGRDGLSYCYVGQAAKSTFLTLSPETLDASLAALKSGKSALMAGPLKEPLSRLPADASKLLLVNVGGAIRMAHAHLSSRDKLSQVQSEVLSQLAEAFANTAVQFYTAESPNRLTLRLSAEELPPMGGVFPLLMRFQPRVGRRPGRAILTVAEVVSPAGQLRSAAARGNLEDVRSLLEQDVDINAADEQHNWTALHWAVFRQHTEVAELLLAKGAKPDVLTAAGMGDWAFIEAKLAEDPAAIETRDGEENTMLHFAQRGEQPEVAKKLLERGADANATNVWGGSVLFYAVRESRNEIVRILLEHGANVNIQAPGNGRTPLHEAAKNGNIELVEFLLEHGAEVNLADNSGSTPLALADEQGHDEVMELLREHGGTQ